MGKVIPTDVKNRESVLMKMSDRRSKRRRTFLVV